VEINPSQSSQQFTRFFSRSFPPGSPIQVGQAEQAHNGKGNAMNIQLSPMMRTLAASLFAFVCSAVTLLGTAGNFA